MTKPTGKPRGRPPKPPKPKLPAHRPLGSTKDFFSYTKGERLLLAHYGSFLLKGYSTRRAALTVVAAPRVKKLWRLLPDEIDKTNAERRRNGLKQRLAANSWIADAGPGNLCWLALRGRVSTIQKIYRRAHTNPLAAHWLRIMSRAFVILGEKATSPDQLALAIAEARLRGAFLFTLGDKVEADLKAMLRAPD